MSTKLRVLGWRASGLRCPDHEINLERAGGAPHRVSLIQMPNGVGKTTTLRLLRAALSGESDKGPWDASRVASYKKKGATTLQGQFQVTLLHNDRRLTVTLDFDFGQGTVDYSTTTTVGKNRGFKPPPDLARFLCPSFVNLFVFDGELAEQLLSHDHTNAESAIEDLFQLTVFPKLIGCVDGYWTDYVAGKSAKEEKGYNRRRNRVTELRDRIEDLTRECDAQTKHADELESQLRKIREKFDRDLSSRESHRQKIEDIRLRVKDAEERERVAHRALLDRLRDPHALSSGFAHRLVATTKAFDRAKLPESAAREFFQDLAQEDTCVCGIPLDEARRAAIRERASKYLASDDVAILNAMKGDVTTYVGTMPDDHEESLRSRAREVRSAMADVGSLRTEKSQLESDAIAGSPELEQAKARIAALESDHREAREALRKYDDPSDAAGDKDTWGLAVLKRRLEDAENKLAEITRTRVMKAKRDTLKLIFEQAHARSRRKLADQIRDDANDRMGKLMPSNLIRIERIDRCLVLSGQEGGSVGETLAVGYSFLATLFSRTDHQLPFIVDSPANSIDLAVRARVAELVPRLAEQFIAFTISSERQGFLESLERTATDGIQYVTVFRRGTPDLDGLAERAGEHVETTTDGMCVSGREFFRRFHLDEDIA